MRRRLPITAVFLSAVFPSAGLGGCGLSEETFADQLTEVSCAKALECYDEVTLELLGFQTEDECVDRNAVTTDSAATDETCEFDADKGRACLDQWDAASCEDMTSGNFDVDVCGDLCVE